jgi:hypothetical protein
MAPAVAQDYPAFVFTEDRQPPATPTPAPNNPPPPSEENTNAAQSTEPEETTPEVIEVGTSRVLVGELRSTETWTATRARIAPALEELRLAFLTGASSSEAQAIAGRMLEDVTRVLLMAPYQAPNQAESLGYYNLRLRRQLDLFLDDYLEGRTERLETTDRLLRETLRDWEALLTRSDLERAGRSGEGPAPLPADWRAPRMEMEEFDLLIAAWQVPALLAAAEERFLAMNESQRNRRSTPPLTVARELSAIGRELATRAFEFPVTSRVPFQNAALRLDVQAENLHDHLRSGHRLHARRQLRVIGQTLRDLDRHAEARALSVPRRAPLAEPVSQEGRE